MSNPDDALSPAAAPAITPVVDGFGVVDPDEQPGGRRRRQLMLVAVVAAVALVAGLLVWQPWSSDNDAVSTTTTAPSLSPELVIDLDGLTLVRSTEASDDFREVTEQDGFIFATVESSLDEGPLLAFLVEPIGDGEEFDSGETTIEIDGKQATVEENDESIEIYWQGEPGVRYGVAGSGVPKSQVVAFAEAVSYEDGITTVNDPDAIEGLQPAGEVIDLWRIVGLTQPLFAVEDNALTVAYATEQGDEITLASVAAPPDFIPLAALILDDEQIVEVDGQQVMIGTLGDTFGGAEDLRVLFSVRDGRLIGITAAGVDDNGLLALLAAVRPATDDEWAAILALVEDPFDNLGGNDVIEETVPATALSDDTEP